MEGESSPDTILEVVILRSRGEMAEWLMAPVLKTGIPERVSGVRIPLSPPGSRSQASGSRRQALGFRFQDGESAQLSFVPTSAFCSRFRLTCVTRRRDVAYIVIA